MSGLAGMSSEELERLASALDRGVLGIPLSDASLRAHGFDVEKVRASAVPDLDARAAACVVRAVIADRAARPATRLDLVWTGPETRIATSRDTAVLVRELFAGAQRDVLIAGFSFDHGEEIFEPLHRVMTDRGVHAEIYLDVQRAPVGMDVETHVREVGARFLTKNWPFGAPMPDLFHDPRTSEAGSLASLHAKCIVIDVEKTLVTSANFTDRGQTRNIELGVLVDDAAFAARVVAQWRSLAASGLLLRIG